MKKETNIIGVIAGLAIVVIIWCIVMSGVIWFILTLLRFLNVIP
jgi:hypothetical protein